MTTIPTRRLLVLAALLFTGCAFTSRPLLLKEYEPSLPKKAASPLAGKAVFVRVLDERVPITEKWTGTEPNEPGEVETAAEEEASVEAAAEPVQTGFQMPADGGNWQQMWADLNLTPEEMARLRQGWALAMERWRNMSEEERQAEMARLRGMRQRWENMSDQEREEAMGRMRDRFQAWRDSGATELPELTLD